MLLSLDTDIKTHYQPRSLYAAFDRYPLPKGASTHIKHMASSLFSAYSPGLLYVLADETLPVYQRETEPADIEIVRCLAQESNLLSRALDYSKQLSGLLAQSGGELKLAHFRDPWSGIPLCQFKQSKKDLKLVYEVNALPSIELPIHIPLPEHTLKKIALWEQECLEQADLIITPSQITQRILQQKVPNKAIHYLPNGADVYHGVSHQAKRPYLIYFGAAQRWQGIYDLLQAYKLVRESLDVGLTLCLSVHNRQARQVEKWVEQFELKEDVVFHFGLNQAELRPLIAGASASLAPLTACRRNMEQGCCPLKVLESMACGTPVIASDLPVIRELMAHNEQGLLTAPGRPGELARVCIEILTQQDMSYKIAQSALEHVKQHFNWATINQTLKAHYQQLLNESVIER